MTVNKKIKILLCISMIVYATTQIATIFTDIFMRNILLVVITYNVLVIPIIVALELYRRKSAKSDGLKNAVIIAFIFIISVALTSNNIKGIVLLFKHGIMLNK